MEDLAEYIKHARHFDGLGMGDSELELKAKKLQECLKELERRLSATEEVLKHTRRDHKVTQAAQLLREALKHE